MAGAESQAEALHGEMGLVDVELEVVGDGGQIQDIRAVARIFDDPHVAPVIHKSENIIPGAAHHQLEIGEVLQGNPCGVHGDAPVGINGEAETAGQVGKIQRVPSITIRCFNEGVAAPVGPQHIGVPAPCAGKRVAPIVAGEVVVRRAADDIPYTGDTRGAGGLSQCQVHTHRTGVGGIVQGVAAPAAIDPAHDKRIVFEPEAIVAGSSHEIVDVGQFGNGRGVIRDFYHTIPLDDEFKGLGQGGKIEAVPPLAAHELVHPGGGHDGRRIVFQYYPAVCEIGESQVVAQAIGIEDVGAAAADDFLDVGRTAHLVVAIGHADRTLRMERKSQIGGNV